MASNDKGGGDISRLPAPEDGPLRRAEGGSRPTVATSRDPPEGSLHRAQGVHPPAAMTGRAPPPSSSMSYSSNDDDTVSVKLRRRQSNDTDSSDKSSVALPEPRQLRPSFAPLMPTDVTTVPPVMVVGEYATDTAGQRRDDYAERYSNASTRTSFADQAAADDDIDAVDFDRLYSTAAECRGVVARVRGVIPKWLNGSLYLNGPGLFEIQGNEYNHLFDPLALIQRFTIEDGNVDYHSRFLNSETLQKNLEAKQIVRCEFGTVSKQFSFEKGFKRLWDKLTSGRQLSRDNCSSGLFMVDGELYATGRQTTIVKLNRSSLQKEAKVDFGPDFHAVTPQWHVDKDGNANAIATRREHYFVLKFQPKEKPPPSSTSDFQPEHAHPSSVAPPQTSTNNDSPSPISAAGGGVTVLVDSAGVGGVPFGCGGADVVDGVSTPSTSCFVSAFGRTAGAPVDGQGDAAGGRFVLVENPLQLRTWRWRLRNLTGGASLADCLQWDKAKRSIFHVLDRNGTMFPIKLYTEAFFNFHIINSFDAENCVVVDLCTYRDSSILHSLYLKPLRDGIFPNYSDRAQIKRFILPLTIDKTAVEGDNLLLGLYVDGQKTRARAVLRKNETVECFPEALTDKTFELPSVNPSVIGKPYRYSYGTEMPFDCSALMGSKVIKLDAKHRRSLEWRRENIHQFIGKPVFVADPEGAAKEDHGVLLVPVTSVRLGEPSYLLFLDAKNLQEIARAEFDFTLPYAFSALFDKLNP